MDLSKALEQVNGQLIDLVKNSNGDSFSYPSAMAIVKREHSLHPFVVWRAIDPSRSGDAPFFESGNYCETLAEAMQDNRL
jgi:hypothetical protein